MQEYEEIRRLVNELEPEIAKVDRGNRAAGVRVRKQLREICTVCQGLRRKILDARKP